MCSFALGALPCCVTPAAAQRSDAPAVLGAAPLGNQLLPQGSPLPRILPPGAPEVVPGLPIAPQAPQGAPVPAVAVPIASVTVEGATVYSAAQLAALTAGLTGSAVPLARVEAARRGIVDLYRADGYVFTTVSAAIDAQHRLRLVVIEGYIAEVKLDGDIGPAGTMVLRFLRHLTETRPIDNATLERWLLLAQDIPGVSVHAVLRPATGQPGALTLIAQVSRQAVSGLLTADNLAYQLTGPVEALGVLDLNSFTEFGDKTEFSLYHTSGNTQNYGQISESAFIGDSGLRVRAYGGTGEAAPSGFLRTIGYEGFTTMAGGSASYPLIRSREQTLNISSYFDVIQTEVRTSTGFEGMDGRQGADSLRVGRIGADYALADLLLGNGRSAVNSASVLVSQGLSALGGTESGANTAQRLNEDTNFTKLTAELIRTQTLFVPWSGASVALKELLVGQYSPNVLPPAEQFFLGGPIFDRGFFSGQVAGDSALAWTTELQLNDSVTATLFGKHMVIPVQYYLFYDWGEVWQNQAIDPNARLASEGAGVRFTLAEHLDVDFFGVVRNTRLPEGTPGTTKAEPAEGLYWMLVTRF